MSKESFNTATIKGYYLVRKSQSVKLGWRLVHETYHEGKKKQKSVPNMVWNVLGFSVEMSLDEAKSRAKQLNKKRSIDKEKARRTAVRVVNDKLIESAFIPKDIGNKFVAHLKDNHFGSELHEKKLLSQWSFVQEMVHSLELDTQDFYDSRNQIYKYFISKKISFSYSSKLLRILNLWGSFVARHRNQHHELIKPPKGHIKEKIQDAYSSSKRYRADGAKPLTVSSLAILEDKLRHLPLHYNWMFISLWFGLRPSEISYLTDTKKYKIEFDEDTGVDVLWVYQNKLSGVASKRRWKPIPIIFDEQIEALQLVKDKAFKKPLNKTIQAALSDEGIGSYSGRKGFTDLMLARGQQLEDISVWLGHATISMTWKHYKDKKKINFTVQDKAS